MDKTQDKAQDNFCENWLLCPNDENRRLALACGLINDPEVILADEPAGNSDSGNSDSGNLDSENKRELHKLFIQLRQEFKKTLVIVTHDRELAGMADRIITMKDGLVVE